MENTQRRQTQIRKIGLVDLFAMVGLVMPVMAVIGEVKRSRGGILAYNLALPTGITLGILIAVVEWKLGKAIWLRFKDRSKRVRNAVGILLFFLQLFWIFAGLLRGDKLGPLAAKHLSR
jgi:hypothetical protein